MIIIVHLSATRPISSVTNASTLGSVCSWVAHAWRDSSAALLFILGFQRHLHTLLLVHIEHLSASLPIGE